MRCAPLGLVTSAVETKNVFHQVTTDVIKPREEVSPSELLKLDGSYRVSRPLSLLERKPKVHSLSRKEAAVFADKVTKNGRKDKTRVDARNESC